MNQKAVLVSGISGVILWLILVSISVISWQIAAVLIAVSLGISSLILTYERTRSETSVKSKREMRKGTSLVFEKDSIREETIFVSPQDAFYYEIKLKKGDHLKGEIFSTEPVDVYFLNETNFEKWEKHKSHDIEDCSEAILDAKINYSVPASGSWFLIIENHRRKSAKVKVHLF